MYLVLKSVLKKLVIKVQVIKDRLQSGNLKLLEVQVIEDQL